MTQAGGEQYPSFVLLDSDRVHAVAQAGGRRAVGKHVSQMAAARLADDLRPDHAVGLVAPLAHAAGFDRLRIARPPSAGVELARSAARSGDADVLSPGCSSFDMFRSFEHRGDVFRQVVAGLAPGG